MVEDLLEGGATNLRFGHLKHDEAANLVAASFIR
jgi:hypothetical protein